MAKSVSSATLSAENKFSDPAKINGTFSFSLSGTWDAIVYVQRSTDGGSTYHDIEFYTINAQMTGYAGEEALFRFGVKTGDYVSGDIVGRIAQ